MNNKNKFFLSIVFAMLVGMFFFLLTNTNYVYAIEDNQQNATLAFGDYNFIAVGEFHTQEGNIIDHFELNEA